MCLLDGVLTGVQAPPWMVHQQLVFASSFSGYGASNHAPPTMGISSLRLIIDCDGHSFALEANNGSFESPQPPLLIQVIDRQSGRQRHCLNGGYRQRL